MQFRLTYRGRLKGSNSKDISHIHELRRHFHKQMSELWRQIPLSEPNHQQWLKQTRTDHQYGVLKTTNGKNFVALISDGNDLLAELDITILRPALPGALVRHGGDLDNRLKTLLDSLRMPEAGEIPPQWQPAADEIPLHCLLSDDKLVTAMSIRSDRLLEPTSGPHPEQDALVIIHVKTAAIWLSTGNSMLVG